MTGRPRFCPLAGAVAPCSLLNTTTATTLCRFAVCIHTGKLPKPRKVKDFYLRRLAMNTADHDAMHKRNCGAAHSWAAWQQVVDKSWPWDKCMLPTAVSRVKTEALFSFFFFSVSRLLLRLHSSVHVLHHSCHPEQQISFLFIYLQQNCVVCCCVCVCVCVEGSSFHQVAHSSRVCCQYEMKFLMLLSSTLFSQQNHQVDSSVSSNEWYSCWASSAAQTLKNVDFSHLYYHFDLLMA